MEYQRLGSSDMTVSKITLGTGNLRINYGDPPDDAELIATIHKALDLGINFFDTADIYDNGHAEEVLAEALGNRRNEVFIATKVGLRYKNKKYVIDLSKEYIKKAIENSLRRLKTDRIDLYQAHWPDISNPLAGTFEALNECVEAGKIRCIGIANFDLAQLVRSCKYSLLSSHQIPLNLFKREYEIQIIPYCYKQNIALLVSCPLAKGLLNGQYHQDSEFTDEFRESDPMFKGATFQRNLAIVERLKHFAVSRNRTMSQLAIAWVLSHPAITSVVCDAQSPEKIKEYIKAINWKLNQEELAQIELLYNIG